MELIVKIEISLIDVCMPCYFNGSTEAYVQILVDCNTTIGQVREEFRKCLRWGEVYGSSDLAILLGSDLIPPAMEKDADRATHAAYAAINRDIKMKGKGKRFPFPDLEPIPSVDAYNDADYAYAFFSLTVLE